MPPINRLVDRFFVGIVASLASLEAAGPALDAYLDGRLGKVLLWGLVAIVMVLTTRTLETMKTARGA